MNPTITAEYEVVNNKQLQQSNVTQVLIYISINTNTYRYVGVECRTYFYIVILILETFSTTAFT